jgi:hypothetical protein
MYYYPEQPDLNYTVKCAIRSHFQQMIMCLVSNVFLLFKNIIQTKVKKKCGTH